MSEIILTVDTPVLKGEKGDKGDTGSFDYGELERIVELNLGDKLEKINKSLDGKVNTDESHSMVDNNVISTFGGLEKWVDNPFVTKDESGKDIEEPRTIVKMFDTKIDSQDLDNKMEEAKGELQTYIDENLEASKSGDMLRSVYDKDRDGVVDLAKQADNASTVNGKTVGTSVPENAIFTDTTYKEASSSEAGLMSISDKVKLNGIASGATRVEVVDALDSTDISKALSANQGKVLNDNAELINNRVAVLEQRRIIETNPSYPHFDNGWTWRKYSDGTVVMFGKKTGKIALTTRSNDYCYRNADPIMFSYPFELAEIINASVGKSNGSNWSIMTNVGTSSIGLWIRDVISVASYSYTAWINIYGICK
ncbi:hypothetical protein [uncultured Anaerofustis sp.]|uniref:hypothetical protein n=1 Tax=uncultured Anaerofustis sp. TaxID=904996 RepID=UPI0025DA0A60|nr:hypothetical protein [uncultured Anaerofustis sp.]